MRRPSIYSFRTARWSTRTACGHRDIGVRDGRIAGIGQFHASQAGRDGRLHRIAHPARRHRHPGPFPRARRRAQGRPRIRLPLGRHGRCHRRLRDAQHQAADDQRGGARRQGEARHRPHALRLRLLRRRHPWQCRRLSRSWNGFRPLPGSRSSWARRPATCSSPTTRACARSCKNARRRVSVHAEDEPRLERAQGPAGRGRSDLPSGLARRGCRADRHRAAHADRRGDRRARPPPPRLDRRGDRLHRRPQGQCLGRGDAAAPDPDRRRLSHASARSCR